MARLNHSNSQIELERHRLSEIALSLFRTEGYEAVTLRKLAAKAGVSHAQPYSYFASKEELFAYMRAELLDQFGEFIFQHTLTVSDPVAQIRLVFHKFVEFVGTRPEEYRLIFEFDQPDPRTHPKLLRARIRLMNAILAIFQRAIDEGSLTGDPAIQAHIAWATVHGLLSLHSSNQLVHGRELTTLIGPAIEQILHRGHSVERAAQAHGNSTSKIPEVGGT